MDGVNKPLKKTHPITTLHWFPATEPVTTRWYQAMKPRMQRGGASEFNYLFNSKESLFIH